MKHDQNMKHFIKIVQRIIQELAIGGGGAKENRVPKKLKWQCVEVQERCKFFN